MAADPRAILGKLKGYVPIGVKRRVRRALPDRYRRFWDPDWHRSTVRGNDAFWDYLGKRQLDYLVEQGLQPSHYVLDVGCGPLRAGVATAAPPHEVIYYATPDSFSFPFLSLAQAAPAAAGRLGPQSRCPRR